MLRILLAAFVALCIFFNVTLPAFEAPDEVSHFTYGAWLAHERRFPNLKVEQPAHEAAQPPLYYLAIALVIAPFDNSNLAEVTHLNPDWFDADVNADFSSVRYVHIPSAAEEFPYRGAVRALHAARTFSTLLGVATIALIYAIARMVRPGEENRSFALFTAALVAFNPKFIHIASIVSNDMAIIFCATLALWQIVRLLRATQPHIAQFALLGAFIGTAALSKLGGFALGLPALLTIGVDRRHSPLRLGAVAAGFLLVCGPWFAWNLFAYGDPLAFERVRAANAALLRATPLGFAEMIAALPHIFISYFGVIGIDLSLPQTTIDLYIIGFVLAVLGCALRISITLKRTKTIRDWLTSNKPLAALVLGQIALSALFVPWLRDYIATENGRLIMPGVAATALLVATGWQQLTPASLRRGLGTLVVASMGALCIAVPLVVICPAYAPPTISSEAQVLQQFGLQPSKTIFGGKVALLHARLAATRLAADEPVRATLYWGARAPIEQSYRTIIELRDADGTVVAQRQFIPYGGRFDTQRWQPDEFFADEYALAAPPAPMQRVLSVYVALHRVYGEPHRIPLDDAGGADAFLIGRLKVAATKSVPTEIRARFGNMLQLNDARISSGHVRFDWSILAAPATDYTLFVHIYDATGKQIAQQDAQPFDGQYPTGLWSVGEFVRDERTLTLPADAHEIRIGWYDARNGERLPAFKPDGSAWANGEVVVERK
ncbi:MAG: glycosyltransferase family 39 protein [Chloroflexi bacterium]|nr:glycosyltransferase family 39 protein [Chloroflexota bacterium]